MISKEQLATISEMFATASIVCVGWALGGIVGAGIMAGIGINLGSDIIQKGGTYLKEKWLSREYGVLNHDIQQALGRALVKALDSLETRYFGLAETDVQPNEKKKAIRGLFKELREIAPSVFAASVERITTDQEVKNYLYGEPRNVRQELWERVEGTKLIYSYYGDDFKTFLRDNIDDEVVRWFGEEIKNDNRESNKAWRAFQRMLLEGIQADVKMIQADQEVIRADLKTLEEVRQRLDEIKDVVDHRTANEPFDDALKKALENVNAVLISVSRTIDRTETKVDVLAATTERTESKIDTVVAALAPKPEPEPQVPDDIQVLLDEAWEFRNAGKYENAKTVLQQALTIADGCEHALARAATKYYSAIILHEWDRNSAGAKELMRECLRQFQIVNAPKRVAMAFYQLGMFELDEGHLDQAEAYFYQSLEIDEKNDYKRGVAATLLMLGWLEDHRGNFGKSLDFYDRVLRYWLSVYNEGDSGITKEAAQSIAGAYQHKGLVYENLGKVEDVESNYLRALEWHRKSAFKPDVGKILYLLARLKYREGQYNDGDQFLDEAVAIYENIGDVRLYALCLDLKARGLFTLGQRKKATSVFELALAAVERADDYKEQVKFLNKLGHIFLKESDLEKAKDYFDQAVGTSLRHGLLEGYADAVKGLAEIAQVENNSSERNRLLEIGIRTLEKHLASLEGEPRRAFTIGQIASFYESMEDFQRALVFYQRAAKLFESIFEIGGVANCLGSIARINGSLGKKGEEFETYRKLKQLVDGTRYYDLIAGAAINLGEINMQMGNLDEAKIMFEEADYLCRKFHLEYVAHLEKSMMRLSAEINTRKPPELNLHELIEELFGLIEWFPEAKDNLLCLWIYGRDHDLYVNYRNRIGLKLMVCEDSVEKFVTVSGALHPYHELCLQVVNDEYQTGLNIVPFPIDKKMFFGNRYQPTSDVGTSKVTRNKGVVLVGWTPGLPPQANQLILSRSATDLIKQKIFFLPYERHLANDKLFSDIRFSKELGLIPVYRDVLPSSDNVTPIHSATISLPAFSDLDVTTYRKEIRAVKRAFNRLLSITKTSALDILNELASEAEELADVNGKTERTNLNVHVLQFPYALSTDVHVGLVVENS